MKLRPRHEKAKASLELRKAEFEMHKAEYEKHIRGSSSPLYVR
jgi:hypothetical protein